MWCGVKVESVLLKGRTATITKEDDFEVDIISNHQINYDGDLKYEVIDYRYSRKNARILAERLIKQDIEKD